MEELLERGHKVTSMFFRSTDLKHSNYTEIVVPSDFPDLRWEVNKVLDGKQMIEKSRGKGKSGGNVVINNLMDPTRWYRDYVMMNSLIDAAGKATIDPVEVQEFLKSGSSKVDAVVTIFPQTATTLAELLDCPIVVFSPSSAPHHVAAGLGGETHLGLQPLPSASLLEPMSLRHRLQNIVLHYTSVAMMDWLGERIFHQQIKLVDRKLPTQKETLRSRSSIILASSNPITHGAWPRPPSTIEVGGLALRPPRPLEEGELKRFMDEADQGVVIVNLGSSITAQLLPTDRLNLLLEVFSQLGLSVVWRWEESEKVRIPPNVLIQPWLPLQDLLAHPNTRLLLAHGGLASLTESLFHATPLLAIPLANDQKQNMMRAQKLGYAAFLDWEGLSSEGLLSAVKTTIEDTGMAAKLKQVREVYLDRERSPRATATWWIEYVCRNEGAKWLKPSLEEGDVSFLQRHYLDLIIFLTTVALLSVFCVVMCCKMICGLCKRRKLKNE